MATPSPVPPSLLVSIETLREKMGHKERGRVVSSSSLSVLDMYNLYVSVSCFNSETFLSVFNRTGVVDKDRHCPGVEALSFPQSFRFLRIDVSLT